MTTVTENDLNDLKDLISSKFDGIDRKFEKVFEEFTDIKIDIATLKEETKAINKRLDTIENNLTKRIDGIDTRLNTLIAVTFTALLGIIGKLIFSR